MIWAGSFMTGEFLSNEMLSGKVDLVAVPYFNGKKGNVINGLGNAVYAKTGYPEQAKRFAAWLGSKEAMDLQGKQGVVISAYTDSQSLFTQVAPELNLSVYSEMAEIARLYPAGKTYSKWYDLLTQCMRQAYSGETTVEDACARLSGEMDTILEDE